MRTKKNILATFDYELFLGRNSGSVQNCLLYPTTKILGVLNELGIKGVFFVDTSYLLQLKSRTDSVAAAMSDYRAICAQISEMVQNGHYVFPHLHPHWKDAEYNISANSWSLFNYTHYRFHNLPADEREIHFSESVKLLEDIVKPVVPEYSIDAFRAGGFCIQPFSDFASSFKKCGIRFDFSVVPGKVEPSEINACNFSGAPLVPYRFENDVMQVWNGTFSEYPVSTYVPGSAESFLNRIERKLLWKFGAGKMGDGNAMESDAKPVNLQRMELLSIEDFMFSKMNRYLSFIAANNYVHFVTHPKMITEYGLQLFRTMMKKIFKNYEVESDFRKMIPALAI